MHTNEPAGAGPVDQLVRPRAWLCELAQEDGTTRTQFVEEDPNGLRWNDAGEPSPYRTTPLYALADVVAECAAVCKEMAERMERSAQICAANGEADEVSPLRSTAWQLTVAAALIEKVGSGPNVIYTSLDVL